MMKRRTTRVERYECGEGKTCSIIGSIAGPLISGGLGLLGGLFGGGNEEQRTTQQQQLPTWSPEQLPYLFGGEAWQPERVMMNPYAVNYAGGLSAGYNPAFGPQVPMDFASLLGGGMGGAPDTPWFMDPGATPQPGGLAALLGIGAGGPPPLLLNAPQFGFGVQNPDLLHQQPGQSLVPSGPTPGEPQPQGPAPLNIDDIAKQLEERERMERRVKQLFEGPSPRYGPWWATGPQWDNLDPRGFK